MKILFFGLGSIGQRHASIVQQFYTHELYAFRHSALVNDVNINITNLFNWKEVVKLMPEVCFICNPTSLHIETAIRCSELGAHLFIEKPVGIYNARLIELMSLVAQKRITTYVAYNLRFHPVIDELTSLLRTNSALHARIRSSSYLPNWRPGVNYLESYTALKEQGGGVIHDLSHELDYTTYLFGDISRLRGQHGRRSNLTIDTEDFADFLLIAGATPVNLHIDFLSHLKQREIVIDFNSFSVVADLINSNISYFEKEELVDRHEFTITRNYTYERQLEYFFSHINHEIMNNIEEASLLTKTISDYLSNIN